MTIYPLDSGSRKITVDLFAKSAGSWRTIQTAHIKDSGSWRQVHGIPRIVFGSGFGSTLNEYGGSLHNTTMYYTNISTTGTVVFFGNISKMTGAGACSSITRGLRGGGTMSDGSPGSGPSPQSSIVYVTIMTLGDANVFGSLSIARRWPAACSSNTRGIFCGGQINVGVAVLTNNMEYVTIATTGTTNDFGTMYSTRYLASYCSSTTRGVRLDGSPIAAAIEYVTISTTGNGSFFGNLVTARFAGRSGFSSSVRGIVTSGQNSSLTRLNSMEYITIATTGNANLFGNLSRTINEGAASSSNIYGLITGGSPSSGVVVGLIDYVTIATTGNATSFGSWSSEAASHVAVSNAHGGLT